MSARPWPTTRVPPGRDLRRSATALWRRYHIVAVARCGVVTVALRLTELVPARRQTVVEELPPLLGVDLPVPVEVFADPDRDPSQVTLGFSTRQSVAVEGVEQHTRGLDLGRGLREADGLRRRADLRLGFVAGGDHARGEAGEGRRGLLRPLVAALPVHLHLGRVLLLERKRFDVRGGGAPGEDQQGQTEQCLRHRLALLI